MHAEDRFRNYLHDDLSSSLSSEILSERTNNKNWTSVLIKEQTEGHV